MPCLKMDHTHHWPTTGVLTIERCERFCDFCTSEADRKHRWKFAWFLRRHVEAVHIKGGEYPGLELTETWTRPDGAAARKAEKQPKKKPPPRKSKGKSKAQKAVSATVSSSLSEFSTDPQVGGLYSSPQQQIVDMSSSPPQPVTSGGYDSNNFGFKNVVNNFDISPVKGLIYPLPNFNGNDSTAGAFTMPDPFAASNGSNGSDFSDLSLSDISLPDNDVVPPTAFNQGGFDLSLDTGADGGVEAPTTTSPTPTTPKRVRRGREPNTPEKRQVVQDVRGTFGSIVRYLRAGNLEQEEIQNVIDEFSDEYFGY
ncbi:hypothetical protein KC336_g18157 [Hortaea werneckii]|nr:hypothetical protein KC336_g18157 [Hortaea werneckii]